jgi:hypothetical protein
MWVGAMGGSGKLSSVSNDDIARWYTVDLLSMQEIADRVGVTRAAVSYRINQMNLTYRGGAVDRKCTSCGEIYLAQRKRVKNGATQFCSRRCYFEAISVHGVYSRAGQRAGRKASQAKAGEVVHHIDGDTLNNDPKNLVVFHSHSQHCAFHKSGAARWLKEKVEAKEVVLTVVTRWPKAGGVLI